MRDKTNTVVGEKMRFAEPDPVKPPMATRLRRETTVMLDHPALGDGSVDTSAAAT